MVLLEPTVTDRSKVGSREVAPALFGSLPMNAPGNTSTLDPRVTPAAIVTNGWIRQASPITASTSTAAKGWISAVRAIIRRGYSHRRDRPPVHLTDRTRGPHRRPGRRPHAKGVGRWATTGTRQQADRRPGGRIVRRRKHASDGWGPDNE